jgi:mRNA interferase RelE/StbE
MDRLAESVADAVFEFMSGPLAEHPHRVGKPLEGELAGRFGARRGEYRIVYTIEDETVTVTVLRVAHRRDAYRP